MSSHFSSVLSSRQCSGEIRKCGGVSGGSRILGGWFARGSRQCCSHRGKILKDQFTSPCPCSWTTKSRTSHSANCPLCMIKILCMRIRWRMSASKPFFSVTRVVVLEESPCPWGPIYKSLSLDLKSLSLSHKSLNTLWVLQGNSDYSRVLKAGVVYVWVIVS